MAKLFCDNTVFVFQNLISVPFTLFSLFFFFILKQKVKKDLLKTKQTNKKKLPSNKGQDQRGSLGKYKTHKEELILILLKHFQIIEE